MELIFKISGLIFKTVGVIFKISGLIFKTIGVIFKITGHIFKITELIFKIIEIIFKINGHIFKLNFPKTFFIQFMTNYGVLLIQNVLLTRFWVVFIHLVAITYTPFVRIIANVFFLVSTKIYGFVSF